MNKIIRMVRGVKLWDRQEINRYTNSLCLYSNIIEEQYCIKADRIKISVAFLTTIHVNFKMNSKP